MDRLIATVLTSILSVAVPAYAHTWTVCSSGCDFVTIQEAVDTARNGDTIELGAETFHENVVVPDGLHCTILGAGRTETVVDGGGIARVFSASGGSLHLANVTIRNGGDGGVHVRGRLVLEDCLVTDNHVHSSGGGISGSPLVILRSTISGNSAGGGGGGVARARVCVLRRTGVHLG